MEIKILVFAKNQNGLIVSQTKVMEKLDAVIKNPCQVTWENAHDIILDGMTMTLWQAVGKINPNYVEYKLEHEDWEAIPTTEIILKAISYAVFVKGECSKN